MFEGRSCSRSWLDTPTTLVSSDVARLSAAVGPSLLPRQNLAVAKECVEDCQRLPDNRLLRMAFHHAQLPPGRTKLASGGYAWRQSSDHLMRVHPTWVREPA